jgi:hypothetical protein
MEVRSLPLQQQKAFPFGEAFLLGFGKILKMINVLE